MNDHTTATTIAGDDVPARRLGERRRPAALTTRPFAGEDRRRGERRRRIPGFFGLVHDLIDGTPMRR